MYFPTTAIEEIDQSNPRNDQINEANIFFPTIIRYGTDELAKDKQVVELPCLKFDLNLRNKTEKT